MQMPKDELEAEHITTMLQHLYPVSSMKTDSKDTIHLSVHNLYSFNMQSYFAKKIK